MPPIILRAITKLPGFRPGRNLVELETLIQQAPQCRVRGVMLDDGKTYGVDEEQLAYAAGLSTPTICQAGHVLSSEYPYDASLIAPLGFDAPWLASVQHNVSTLEGLHRQARAQDHIEQVDRALHGTHLDEARGALRALVMLTQTASLRRLFNTSTDWQRRDGVIEGLLEFSSKARHPALRQKLLDAGVTESMIDRVEQLYALLDKEDQDRHADQAAEDALAQVMLFGGALITSDIRAYSTAVRAVAVPARWEQVQISRFFPTSPRRPGPRDPEPAPAPAPTPATQPSPDAPRPAPGTVQPPQPGPTPQPTPAAAPNPPPFVPQPAYPSAALPAGTVVATMLPMEGPALAAVVQPDGTVKWAPMPAAPGKTPGAPRPARPKAASPRRTGRR